MNKPIRIARHVYLRTQQRRLRHVRGILIRNLTLANNTYLKDPLRISVFFTVHVPSSPDRVLFTSESVYDSYNPSWESMQLATYGLGHHPSFILRVWVRCIGEDGEDWEESSLAFEKKVELFDLSYLGIMVNKDGSSYPPNSVVIGMYEGLYSHPEVGGVPCAPRVVHTLTDYLPPQSLLEVQKKEVVDSYLQPVLTRILRYQEELNVVRRRTRLEKAKVQHYLQVEREVLEKREERERLVTRLKLFKAQLKEMESPERDEREQLERVIKQVDEAELDLKTRTNDLKEKKENLKSAMSVFTHKRDQMQRYKRNRHFRQRYMVYELANTFVICEREDTYTICNVILPNADHLDQPGRVEQLGVALGYVAHLIHHLGKILFIPLLYPIKPQGSKSVICDLVSDETLIDNIKEFPLYAKGSEKALFMYAVFLLNKDIAQVRQHCGYGTSKSMFKRTLPNLKFLLDRLTRDIKSMLRGSNHGAGFNTRYPHDTTSMTSSYVSVDTISIASAGSMVQSPERDSIQSFSSQYSSMYPSTYTQTQQFIQNDDISFSPINTSSSSDLAESIDHYNSTTDTMQSHCMAASPEHSDGARKPCNDNSTASEVVTDEIDTPLAELTTEHTFTQPLNTIQCTTTPESERSRKYFSSVDQDEEEEEDDDDEDCSMRESGKSDSSDSTTNSLPSLSTTPVVPQEFTTLGESWDRSRPSVEELKINDAGETQSLTKLSSSAVSQTGPLEDTLKSAVHVTQLLMGHTAPEQIPIEPAPTILNTNTAEIESTQALIGLTAAAFSGNVALEVPHDMTTEEKTVENGEKRESEDFPSLQAPPMFPDSFELTSLTNRHSHNKSDMTQENDRGDGSEFLQPRRPRSMAFTAFNVDNVGYVKTSMATPHRVGGSTHRDDEGRSLNHSAHKMNRGLLVDESSENGRSLADFIDRSSDTRNGPQNRWKLKGPGQFGYRDNI